MGTFAFETKKGFRIDVKASTLNSAVNKIESISYVKGLLTGYYYKYDSEGLHCVNSGWDGKIDFN